MSDAQYCLFLSTEELDPVSAAIRFKTECAWSHVGFLRLSDNWTFSAMSDGKGVAWRPPNPHAKILKLNVPHVEIALAKFLTQQGKPYDKLDIVGIALGLNLETKGHFICSVGVVWSFEDNLPCVPLVNPTFIPREHITPRDILLSPFVTEIKP